MKNVMKKDVMKNYASSLPMPATPAIIWQKEEWHKVLLQLSKCKTYIELKQKITLNPLPPPIVTIKRAIEEDDLIDSVAMKFYASDGPTQKFPIETYGDGNCFSQALSHLFFRERD